MASVRIDIKPMSVNDCWQGRRFKTAKYKAYEKLVLYRLPKFNMPEPPYRVVFKWGFSSKLSDLDNPVKPMTDILQMKYGFNDRDIHRMEIDKVKVPKGEEFIEFEITSL